MDRFASTLPELSTRVVAQFAADLPAFRALPDAVLHVEVGDCVRESLAVIYQAVLDDRALLAEEAAAPLRRVMGRVNAQVSLSEILSAYFLGVRTGWQNLAAMARPEERDLALGLVDGLLRSLQMLIVAMTETYLEEQAELQNARGEARHDLTVALLVGEPTGELEQRAGTRLADAYVVLVWEHPDARGTGWLPRSVRQLLDECFATTVLSVLRTNGGIALLPVLGEGGDQPVERVPAFRSGLASALHAPVTAATARAHTPTDLPRAVEEAREVLDVAVRLSRPPAEYCLDDLLQEVLLSRPSAVTNRLAARFAPLLERPELVLTLRAYLGVRLNRRKAAAALHVHPNTLDYRLQRIAAMTGLDTHRPADLQVLASALTVVDLRSRS